MTRDDAKVKVLIASSDDRDSVVAEVWVGEHLLAEVYRDGKKTRLSIFSAPTPAPHWDVSFSEIRDALEGAEAAL